MDAVEVDPSEDWYGQNPDWADDLPDLGEREEETDGLPGSVRGNTNRR